MIDDALNECGFWEIELLMKMELVEKNGILVDMQDILDVME
jgi:hypothetical protein